MKNAVAAIVVFVAAATVAEAILSAGPEIAAAALDPADPDAIFIKIN